MSIHHLNYLDQLEAESIYILREVAGQFERPALLFSGGKDSIVLAHLARKGLLPRKNSVYICSCRYGTQLSGGFGFP